MKIGLIQMEVIPGEKDRNIDHGFALLEEAASKCDIAILPELWTIGYDFRDLHRNVTHIGDPLYQKVSELAKRTKTVIFAGTLPIEENGIIRNTSLIFGADGELKDTYSKRHLFYGYLESELMRPGEKSLHLDLDGVQIGMAVCYEFYFPKMWRKMAKEGITLVIGAASWPLMHIYQWDILTRARAIENGVCIAAVNMAGEYRGLMMGGPSRFIDPLGKILAETGEKESIIYADYDEEKYKGLGKQLAVIKLDKQKRFEG